jgi:hypothetical protein
MDILISIFKGFKFLKKKIFDFLILKSDHCISIIETI